MEKFSISKTERYLQGERLPLSGMVGDFYCALTQAPPVVVLCTRHQVASDACLCVCYTCSLSDAFCVCMVSTLQEMMYVWNQLSLLASNETLLRAMLKHASEELAAIEESKGIVSFQFL